MWLPVEKRLAPERAPLRRPAGPEQGRDGGEVRRAAGARLAPQLRHAAAAADRRRSALRRRRTRATPAIEVPRTECLKDTVARVLPYWESAIAPAVRAGKRVLIAAHGNSLRALVKHLDDISDEEIVGLNIPTGVPLVYELDDDLKPLKPLLPRRPRRDRAGASPRSRRKGRPRPDAAPFFSLLAWSRRRLRRRSAGRRPQGAARAHRRAERGAGEARKSRSARRATRCATPSARFRRPTARSRALAAEARAGARRSRAHRRAPRALWSARSREREAAIERMLVARPGGRRARRAARGAVRRRSRRPRAARCTTSATSRAPRRRCSPSTAPALAELERLGARGRGQRAERLRAIEQASRADRDKVLAERRERQPRARPRRAPISARTAGKSRCCAPTRRAWRGWSRRSAAYRARRAHAGSRASRAVLQRCAASCACRCAGN